MRGLPINRDSAFIVFIIATDIFVIIIVVDTCGDVAGGGCAHYQWHHCNPCVENFNKKEKCFIIAIFSFSAGNLWFSLRAALFKYLCKKKGKSEADFLINAWCGEKKNPDGKTNFYRAFTWGCSIVHFLFFFVLSKDN